MITLIALSLASSGLPPVRGAIDPSVTQDNIHATVCVRGYTKTVRPTSGYTNALKAKQMRTLGLPGPMSQYEEDHLIPLSIGGAPRDPQNLWPEPRYGVWSASVKDQLETKLYHMVCHGGFPLARAQQAFATNWIAAYQRYIAVTPRTKAQQRTTHKRRKKSWWRF
jgi:hypothetical protein